MSHIQYMVPSPFKICIFMTISKDYLKYCYD